MHACTCRILEPDRGSFYVAKVDTHDLGVIQLKDSWPTKLQAYRHRPTIIK